METRKRFLLSLLLIASLSVSIAQDAFAAEKASFAYQTIENSLQLPQGRFDNHFKYPKLKGSSNAIKKINTQLEKEGEKHISTGGYTIDEIKEFIIRDNSGYNTFCKYFNTADGKVSYNKNGIFSIQYNTAWFVGGVSNYDTFGDTFDLETGKKLNLFSVVSDEYSDYSSLKEEIHSRLLKKYDSEIAGTFYENYNSKKKLSNADYYITKAGKVMVCFRTYDISYGASGCLTVSLPSCL